MHKMVMSILVCPSCHGNLDWEIQEQEGDMIVDADIGCEDCGGTYFVADSIGIFLTKELDRNDLWEESESAILQFLDANPVKFEQLMNNPDISPTDAYFKATILREKEQYDEAQRIIQKAMPLIYTEEYLEVSHSQKTYMINKLAQSKYDVILDIASGVGTLVFELVDQFDTHVILSDFSQTILRKNKTKIQRLGIEQKVSQLAFDARKTPFQTSTIPIITTYLGFPNIENPGNLLKELKRIAKNSLYAIHYFLPEDDRDHFEKIEGTHLENVLREERFLDELARAGWSCAIENRIKAPAKPTPKGEIVPAKLDGFPMVDTILDWCVLIAS